jgi:hypothetical protein
MRCGTTKLDLRKVTRSGVLSWGYNHGNASLYIRYKEITEEKEMAKIQLEQEEYDEIRRDVNEYRIPKRS